MVDDITTDTEWWWIDYLEDELDPALERDLAMLLDHSQEDRDAFENFRLLKQWVRESDPAAKFDGDLACARIRSNVMAAIQDLEIDKIPTSQPRNLSISAEP